MDKMQRDHPHTSSHKITIHLHPNDKEKKPNKTLHPTARSLLVYQYLC